MLILKSEFSIWFFFKYLIGAHSKKTYAHPHNKSVPNYGNLRDVIVTDHFYTQNKVVKTSELLL